MFNHRSVPYLIVVGIVVFLTLCYMGYREYQKHVEFETFMAKVQATLDKDANPSEQLEANPQGIDTNAAAMPDPINFLNTYRRLSNTPHPIDSLGPPIKVGVISKEQEEKQEETAVPVDWSKFPPETLAKLKQLDDSPMKPTRIQLPDGRIHVIYLPAAMEDIGGDILVSEELANSPALVPVWEFEKPMSVQDSEIPEGETAESYLEKMEWGSLLGVSIEEVEKMMENGHIPQRKIISRSPVVEFSIEALIGDDNPPRSSGSVDDALLSGKHRAEAPVSDEGLSEGARSNSVHSNAPLSLSDLPDMVESIPSPPSVEDIEKQLTPEGIEAELSQGVSSDSFDKAQQLIDQYGTEEGLRRLRESDPDAAERFERGYSAPTARDKVDDVPSTR